MRIEDEYFPLAWDTFNDLFEEVMESREPGDLAELMAVQRRVLCMFTALMIHTNRLEKDERESYYQDVATFIVNYTEDLIKEEDMLNELLGE